jgi:hypothetical protein
MSTLTAKKKSVGYAYPTSPSAQRFGFAHTGCYTVNVGVNAIAGYATRQEALKHAESLAGEWCPMYLKYSVHTRE